MACNRWVTVKVTLGYRERRITALEVSTVEIDGEIESNAERCRVCLNTDYGIQNRTKTENK